MPELTLQNPISQYTVNITFSNGESSLVTVNDYYTVEKLLQELHNYDFVNENNPRIFFGDEELSKTDLLVDRGVNKYNNELRIVYNGMRLDDVTKEHGRLTINDVDEENNNTSSLLRGIKRSRSSDCIDDNPITITIITPDKKSVDMKIDDNTIVALILYKLREMGLLTKGTTCQIECDGVTLDRDRPLLEQDIGNKSVLTVVYKKVIYRRKHDYAKNPSSFTAAPKLNSINGTIYQTVLSLSPLDELQENGFTYISGGNTHSAAIDRDGNLFSWGFSEYGALEPVDKITYSVAGIPKVKMVCCGYHFTVALTIKDELYAWGVFVDQHNTITSIGERNKPTLIDINLAKHETVVEIAAGAVHFLVRTSRGRIFSCGCCSQYQLGRSIDSNDNLDQFVLKPLNLNGIKHIACGLFNSFAINEHGDMFAWGLNRNEQTGIPLNHGGRTTKKFYVETPTRVMVTNVKQISAAKEHTIILLEDGKIRTYGITSETEDLSLIKMISAGESIDTMISVHGEIYYRLNGTSKWEGMCCTIPLMITNGLVLAKKYMSRFSTD